MDLVLGRTVVADALPGAAGEVEGGDFMPELGCVGRGGHGLRLCWAWGHGVARARHLGVGALAFEEHFD